MAWEITLPVELQRRSGIPRQLSQKRAIFGTLLLLVYVHHVCDFLPSIAVRLLPAIASRLRFSVVT